MNMKIVSKQNAGGKEQSVIRTLNYAESLALKNFYGLDIASPENEILAVRIAKLAKSSNAWLLCDCRADPPAYLYPRLTESGSVTLVRPCSLRQTIHDFSCPFHHATEVSSRSDKTTTLIRKPKYALLSVKKTDKPKQLSTSLNTSNKAHKHSLLAWNMLSLLNDSNAFKLSDHHFPSFKVICDEIRRVAKEKPLWSDTKMSLDDILLVSIKHRFSYFTKLRDNAEFRSNHRKQGYAITLVEFIENNELRCMTGEIIKIEGEIKYLCGRSSGPYIALLQCAEQKEGSGYFSFLKAVLIPIYSRSLPFVVFSNEGREMMRQLIAWRMYWQKKGEDFQIGWFLGSDQDVNGVFSISDEETGRSVAVANLSIEKKIMDYDFSDFSVPKPIIYDEKQDLMLFKQTISKALWGRG